MFLVSFVSFGFYSYCVLSFLFLCFPFAFSTNVSVRKCVSRDAETLASPRPEGTFTCGAEQFASAASPIDRPLVWRRSLLRRAESRDFCRKTSAPFFGIFPPLSARSAAKVKGKSSAPQNRRELGRFCEALRRSQAEVKV